jgi:hypothetical protein
LKKIGLCVSNGHSPDEHHAVLVVDVVIGSSVVDHEVLATKGLDVVEKAASAVANLSKHNNYITKRDDVSLKY